MTGIEQLRKLGADAVRGGEVGRAICDIADQIERERECERDTIENLRLELGEARDEAAWVREHGGLESVKERLDWVVGHCSTKQQLDFDFWLSGRVMHELGFDEDMADRDEVERRLLARLMPEGCEWPRYESGELVQTGATFAEKGTIENVVASIELSDDWFAVHGFDGAIDKYSKGERVKRPVPAADGELLEVGQTVYTLNEDRPYTVKKVEHNRVHVNAGRISFDVWKAPTYLTHQRPVLDADGVPIREGDTVWEVGTVLAIHMTVVEVSRDTVRCEYAWTDGKVYRPCCSPDTLTHAKPEIDTWQRIEEDAGCTATKYNERRGTIFTTKQQVARDLVRRCRALAERERGE